MTLELWRDPENDGERSLLLGAARCAARARSPTAWACRTSRSTCATEFRAGVVDRGWPTTPPG